MNRSELVDYIQHNYGVDPETPWGKFPEYIVFRRRNNAKWFAVIIRISSNKLDTNKNEEMVNIVNLKAAPELIGSLRLKDDIYPAYHMNKEHWITIKLPGSLTDSELKELIEDSYKLTA
ncbi:MmcQ/YjbR family DNA-binding protein [Providencia hangzhouensis]|uniref:MmcQ/YjbR family DNA-binding protein n=1 Tax=Providencia hangzhouensis TaxID=3031799 RepID=UPI0034DD64CF